LQEALAGAGLLPSTSADGIFGARTLAAVKKFQQSKGLTADGIVGAATWEVLLSAPSSMKGIPSMAKTMSRGGAKKGGVKKVGAKKGGAKKGGSKKAAAGKKRAAKKR
jgi:peptidoglycan hydrolase-like protein with peptidoglycan-binding domain